MFSLGDHVRRNHTGICSPVRQDENLTRPRRKVDLHVAPQKNLGRCDIDIARPHNLLHPLQALGA